MGVAAVFSLMVLFFAPALGAVIVVVQEKSDVIKQELMLCGYFVIVTSAKMTAKDAIDLYYSRDASEKLFRGDKSYLGNKSLRVYSSESADEKIFVEFVALIVRNRIYKRLKDESEEIEGNPNYMTVPAALRELEKIEMIRARITKESLEAKIQKAEERVIKTGKTYNAACDELKALRDTATSGIRKVFRIQKAKFFPLPDYDLSDSAQVSVKIYGRTIDARYTHILYDNPDLPLEVIFLIDKVQKGRCNELKNEDVKLLRKYKLVEGRKSSLFLSSKAAEKIGEKTNYIKNKGFSDQYYKDLILDYLKEYKKAKRNDITELLWDKLPDSLSDKQKKDKIRNILQSMRRAGTIVPDSQNKQTTNWVLL